MPIPAGVYGNLQAGEGGKIFYRKEDPPPTSTSGGHGDSSIRVYDLTTRKDEAIGPANFGFRLTADRKKMLVASRGAWSILPTAGKPEPGKGRLAVEAVEVRVVPDGRVAADLRRGLAHQPRLFLRSELSTAPTGRP